MRKLQAIRFLQHQIIHGATLCSSLCTRRPAPSPPRMCLALALAAISSTHIQLPASLCHQQQLGVCFVLFFPSPLCILGQSAAFFKNAFWQVFLYSAKMCRSTYFISSTFSIEQFIFITQKKLQVFFFPFLYFIHPVCINSQISSPVRHADSTAIKDFLFDLDFVLFSLSMNFNRLEAWHAFSFHLSQYTQCRRRHVNRSLFDSTQISINK